MRTNLRGTIGRLGLPAALTCCLMIGIGCGSKDTEAPAVPPATVARPIEKVVVEWDDFPSRFESPQFANIAARVGGIVEQAPFTEGSLVKKGDLLFVIDERPFVADLKSKDADTARAEALLAQADARARRYETLKGTRAISAEDYDEVRATLSQARANVAVAQASRDVARLNLEWTKVLAPITGRVSKKYVTEGNLVAGGNAQGSVLTTITSIDPLYVSATIPERAFLNYQKLGETTPGAGQPEVPCLVRLENEKDFARQGILNFFDNKVDPSTGTVEIRCTLSNTDGRLVPGLFAHIRIPASKPYSTLLVPDVAIGTDQASRFVLTIGPDNMVTRKGIELGATFGSFRAVINGISKDDRLILTGLQQLRPGTKVEPKETPLPEESLQPFLAKSEPQLGAKAPDSGQG